jgi:hydrogenase/urease accessory protein HupE
MSTQRSRIRLFFASVMIVASIAGLVEGHLSTFQLVLYVFVIGLGLFIVATAVTQSRRRE